MEVTADVATQVDTQTSSINQVVGQTQIASLPSLTRDPYDFVQTLGNVNQDSAAGNGGQDMVPRGTGVAVNGQRSSSVDAPVGRRRKRRPLHHEGWAVCSDRGRAGVQRHQ